MLISTHLYRHWGVNERRRDEFCWGFLPYGARLRILHIQWIWTCVIFALEIRKESQNLMRLDADLADIPRLCLKIGKDSLLYPAHFTLAVQLQMQNG